MNKKVYYLCILTSPDESEEEESDSSEDQDQVSHHSLLPKSNNEKASVRHDYSEIDSDGEVFELPSNSESFKAGTIFRSSNR